MAINGFFGVNGLGGGMGAGGGSGGGGGGVIPDATAAALASPFLSMADMAAMTPEMANALLSAYMGLPGMPPMTGNAAASSAAAAAAAAAASAAANFRPDDRNKRK